MYFSPQIPVSTSRRDKNVPFDKTERAGSVIFIARVERHDLGDQGAETGDWRLEIGETKAEDNWVLCW